VVILDSASGPSPTSFTAAIENLFQKQFGEIFHMAWCEHEIKIEGEMAISI
jgi:hypothetical protein